MTKQVKRRTGTRANQRGAIYHPTRREIAVLIDLQRKEAMTPLQICSQYFPPDLLARLQYHGLPKLVSKQMLERLGEEQVYERTEFLKWLKNLHRVLQLSNITRRQDIQTWDWLQELSYSQKQQYEELVSAIRQLEQRAPQAWLVSQRARKSEITQAYIESLSDLLFHPLPVPVAYAQRLVYPSQFVSTQTVSSLGRLEGAGFIEARPYRGEAEGQDKYGRISRAFFLTKKGRDLVAREWGVPVGEVSYKNSTAFGDSHLLHRLEQNTLWTMLELEAERFGTGVSNWQSDGQLRKRLSGHKVVLLQEEIDRATGEITEVAVEESVSVPDDMFILRTEEVERVVFIELDRATHTQESQSAAKRDIKLKFQSMQALAQPSKQFPDSSNGQLKQVFSEVAETGNGLWYWFVTTSEQRMRNTKALAEGCINPRAIDRYFFTYLDKIELPWQNFFSVEGSLLKGQVWLRGGSESWQALPLEWGKRF